ncbi:uncharacterized protein LOC115923564 [Strongylocentrotus purpuratus]|uniref:DUF4440 domain-containing protein n=1 Tax=Strongylocentrotus purpuratus TaxID=7668 RepID=A0A7M7G0Z1_STRPU|nr:uncharacterized protein LOC753812 [Strongylocentrotus purpuratus]XP_030840397.1 uncharacterized protein LOC115923564 [Strongylocentrotus purpuratus]|eukprot:XP_001183453.2 PREDICTED: uncharacterized protein LOC753812 [Strongylocentrotus purpuratus]
MACATSTNTGNDELDVSITEAIVQAHSMYDELYNSRQLEKMVDSIYAEDCCVMMEGRDVIRGRKELLELLCGFSKDPSHHRVESNAMEIREITAPGQRIYELGRYSFFDIPNTGRADGRHVIVWTRIGGKYFITLQSINPIT